MVNLVSDKSGFKRQSLSLDKIAKIIKAVKAVIFSTAMFIHFKQQETPI